MWTCRQGMFYINSHQTYQCDYLSPSININHINVIISPPLTSMTKGHSPLGVSPLAWTFLGVAPPVWMPLIFLWTISLLLNKGYHFDAKDTSLILPLWPFFPLELCLCALSSSIGLFSHPRTMGIRMTPPMGMSPPNLFSRWPICYHMMILGPVHASNSCHTNHHETKDMSNIENHE